MDNKKKEVTQLKPAFWSTLVTSEWPQRAFYLLFSQSSFFKVLKIEAMEIKVKVAPYSFLTARTGFEIAQWRKL